MRFVEDAPEENEDGEAFQVVVGDSAD